MINKIGKTLLVLVVLLTANIVSSFIFGMLLAIGGNIQIVGINKLAFDPLITIAYMMLYYFMTLFFDPAARIQLYIFLFTLFLSFTVNFIQGAIFLVVLFFLLRKFELI